MAFACLFAICCRLSASMWFFATNCTLYFLCSFETSRIAVLCLSLSIHETCDRACIAVPCSIQQLLGLTRSFLSIDETVEHASGGRTVMFSVFYSYGSCMLYLFLLLGHPDPKRMLRAKVACVAFLVFFWLTSAAWLAEHWQHRDPNPGKMMERVASVFFLGSSQPWLTDLLSIVPVIFSG